MYKERYRVQKAHLAQALDIARKIGGVSMVIQSNMSPQAIVEVWNDTVTIFEKYHVPLSEKRLEAVIAPDTLPVLLKELNNIVGSSSVTCIEGG